MGLVAVLASLNGRSAVTTQTVQIDVACDRVLPTSTGSARFAVHEFPGRREEAWVGRAHVLGHRAQPVGGPQGYALEVVQKGIYIKESAIAIACGRDEDPNRYDRVLIIMPRDYVLQLDAANPY
jgi:hypothetical protein